MAKQKTTIEKLANEMKGGFERVDKKIDEFAGMVQKGFEGVNERFDKVDVRLDKVEDRLDKVEGRLGDVENKLDAIEIEILDIKKKIDNVIYRHEFETLKDRVAYLEKLLTAKKSR